MAAVLDADTDADTAAGASDVGPATLDVAHIESRLERSLVGKVRRLTDDFPERALEVIRGWMAER